MTTPSESATDRLAEIRARVEALNAGDDSARYAARAVLEVNAPSDIPWLLERLGVEGLVAKLADENCRALQAEVERLRAGLRGLVAEIEQYGVPCADRAVLHIDISTVLLEDLKTALGE